MSLETMQFVGGAMTMGFGVSGLFFLRFWRRTHDRLFLLFSLAFFIMAVNRVGLVLMERRPQADEEAHAILYFIRLVAFVLILVAIVDKNRARREAGGRAAEDSAPRHRE